MKKETRFSIITPSYNMLGFLPMCCNSVADQQVKYEHIIVDGASTDGTKKWLGEQLDVISVSENDKGMYDAINKGIALAKGEIISYLNCDEQYLPGTLQKVTDFFDSNPKVDILFGNTLVIRPSGELLAFRKSFVPRWPYVWASDLYIHSSSMFVRRGVFEAGIKFNEKWKMVGDMDFVINVLRKGFNAQHMDEYLSAYMLTGSNLGNSEQAYTELKRIRENAPVWVRSLRVFFRIFIRLEKVFKGAYWEKMPLSHFVYSINNLEHRSRYIATSASALFPREVG